MCCYRLFFLNIFELNVQWTSMMLPMARPTHFDCTFRLQSVLTEHKFLNKSLDLGKLADLMSANIKHCIINQWSQLFDGLGDTCYFNDTKHKNWTISLIFIWITPKKWVKHWNFFFFSYFALYNKRQKNSNKLLCRVDPIDWIDVWPCFMVIDFESIINCFKRSNATFITVITQTINITQ